MSKSGASWWRWWSHRCSAYCIVLTAPSSMFESFLGCLMTRQVQGMASTERRFAEDIRKTDNKAVENSEKMLTMVLVRLLKGNFGSAGAHEAQDEKALRLLRNYQTSAQSRLSWNGLFLIQELASFLRCCRTKQLQYHLFNKTILQKLQASHELGGLGTDRPYILVNEEYRWTQIQKDSTSAMRHSVETA